MATDPTSETPAYRDDLTRINLNAAGIDVGSRKMYVAVPTDRSETPVRSFGTYTADLHQIAKWLYDCGVTSVAMESTGVYWIPLWEILEGYGIDVILVDARRVKNVSGRKADVSDAQWLQTLHTYGLLAGCFRPEADIRVLRSYLRQRQTLVESRTECVLHMHKALMQMNIQLQQVVADITGVTGMRIMRAIIAGERDLARLADMRDHRVRASNEKIAAALVGDWRAEHIFALRQAIELYDVYEQKLSDCDEQILAQLERLESRDDDNQLPPSSKNARRTVEQERIRRALYRTSDSALGAYRCTMKGRLGPAKAIKATAHRIAIHVYRALRFGGEYVDIGQQEFERIPTSRVGATVSDFRVERQRQCVARPRTIERRELCTRQTLKYLPLHLRRGPHWLDARGPHPPGT